MSDSRLRLRLRLIFNGTGRDRQRSSAHFFLIFFWACLLACVLRCGRFGAFFFEAVRHPIETTSASAAAVSRALDGRPTVDSSAMHPHLTSTPSSAAFRFDSHVLNETSRHNPTYLPTLTVRSHEEAQKGAETTNRFPLNSYNLFTQPS